MALGYDKKTHLYKVLCAGGCQREVCSKKRDLDKPHFCRSCSQIRSQQRQPRHKRHSILAAIDLLRHSAEARGVSCSITGPEYLQLIDFPNPPMCHYCSHLVVVNSSAYRLDRKDNTVGYTKENCVVCCGECNRIKSDLYSYEEMVEIGKALSALSPRPTPVTNNGKKFIYNKQTGQRRLVRPSQVSAYLNGGWQVGKGRLAQGVACHQ